MGNIVMEARIFLARYSGFEMPISDMTFSSASKLYGQKFGFNLFFLYVLTIFVTAGLQSETPQGQKSSL